MFAGGGEPQTEARAPQQHPHAPDDEGHHQHEDGESAVGAKGIAEPWHAEGRGHRREAAEEGLHGERRAADPKSRQAETGDDRIGAQLLDHEPEQDRGGDAEHAGDRRWRPGTSR